jgi:hypothetical protein
LGCGLKEAGKQEGQEKEKEKSLEKKHALEMSCHLRPHCRVDVKKNEPGGDVVHEDVHGVGDWGAVLGDGFGDDG